MSLEPHALIAEEAGRFREVFANNGYNEQGLIDTLGPIRLPRRLGRDRAHFAYLTRRGRPIDTLIRLFLLGMPEDLEPSCAALAPLSIDDWTRAGLIQIDGTQVRGLVRMMAFRTLLLACDQQETPGSEERADQVMGMTASTVALADAAPRRPIGNALDIGTGNGVQAFLLASHSGHVTATDASARAVNFARFNAVFNGCEKRIEFLEGDAFAPVRGRAFDLIVSNPPFALTPSCRFVYRDSGLPLDGFARGLIENGARALNEGGYCQIVCDWAHIQGQDWKERLAGWFAGTGCDAWVMRTDHHDAADYAHIWIRDTEEVDADETARMYDEWLGYYARERIEGVSTGLITMRKTGGIKNWLRIEDGPDSNSGPFGEYVLRGFGLRDFLEAVSTDQALLGIKLKVADGIRLDHVCEWEDASWRIRSAKIRLSKGLQYEGNMDLRMAGIMALCDGKHTIREVLEKTAGTLGTEVQALVAGCLPLLRQLIERGFLIPA